ncbi:phosphate ABC transporter substrate-binding protein (PhoT family) [Micromonospora sp. Llam0]|uniref:phosphate ABC transporter substrate-binding protein PstS family protein n=1 Tax=Micromonospora sp. Llam0 TaxID=2485143 RepID=UPI000FBEEA69|nr:phosphate ABC transporter substrate-binding protein PstS family protein [Micromonospora sp. Llam0]ROO51511.1 phosphate ABC transporter substrate-binding protein (PhoT family) [Micromonospora sp. Llam0]
MTRRMRSIGLTSAALALALAAAACGSGDSDTTGSDSSGLSGTIVFDGSSTVAPLSETAAEAFEDANPGVSVPVGTSGTSGGFEKFCNGELDMTGASRAIKESEVEACAANDVAYAEVQVANDALGAVVHPDNPLQCITVDSLKQIWDLDSPVDSWGDVTGLETELPDEPITLYGAGEDSGTFDYWTEAINGEEGRITTGYNDIGEDDNAAVNGVSGDPWAMAFVPFSYVQEAGGKVRALEVQDPATGECVAATLDNVIEGAYNPLGRPLFWYATADAVQRPEVVAFFEFYLENQEDITTEAIFIPLNDAQVEESKKRVADLGK